jgi:hypothetical protein
MSSPEMPADPFGAPEELVTMMKGLAQIHDALMMAGKSEKVATDFISNIFLHLMAGTQQNTIPS